MARTSNTPLGALLLRRGDGDALICGPIGRFQRHLQHVDQIIGKAPGVKDYATLSALIMEQGPLFLADTYVSYDPTAEQLAEMTMMAAEEVRRFGIEPKVAFVSHSNFGSADTPSSVKMRQALALLRGWAPDLEAEGEMHADAALSPFIREEIFPNSRLQGCGQSADHADAGCGQHRVQPAEGGVVRRGGQSDPAGRCEARAYRDAVGDGARAVSTWRRIAVVDCEGP